MGKIQAVLFDLGDVLMVEESEEKDSNGVTERADLRDGAVDVLQTIKERGYKMALVADTKIGTYQNVLRQHGVFELFDAFAISDELGCSKPDRQMFEKALADLEMDKADWKHTVMVGNNLRKDICGANRLGITSIWTHWNERYHTIPRDRDEEPNYTIGPLSELVPLLDQIEETLS